MVTLNEAADRACVAPQDYLIPVALEPLETP